MASDIDFFISRQGNEFDIEIARRVNEILRDAGYTTLFEDENFGHTSFMAMMKKGFDAIDKKARLIAVLSQDYMVSEYCIAECHYPLIGDPQNQQERLIVFRIDDCSPTGFLKPIPFIDFFGGSLLNNPERFKKAVLIAVGHIEKDVKPKWFTDLKRTEQIRHLAIKPTPNFTGRAEELAALEQVLWSGDEHRVAITQPAAVHGLGGVGKSILAKQYGWDNRERYAGLWWIDCEQEIGIQEGLIALGRRFIPGLSDVQDMASAANETLNYLASYYRDADKPWLLIYDNIESEELFRDYAPRGGAHGLLTSRVGNFSDDLISVAVDSWPLNDAMDYLRRESGRTFTDEEAKDLSEALGCLPLALSHAAAFLKKEKLTQVSDYLREINEWLAEVPDRAAYPKAVFATFKQAIRKCEAEVPGASSILALSVFFAPEAVKLEFFEQEADFYPEPLKALLASPKHLRSAFGSLDNYSLIDLNADERLFSTHRLIQATAKDEISGDTKRWGASAVRTLNALYPDPSDVKNWPLCEHLVPHILHIDGIVPDDVDEALSRLFGVAAYYLNDLASFKEAEPLYRRALAIDEAGYGPDHPTVATGLGNLAGLLRITNRFGEAEPLFRRALAISEASYGPDHPSVAIGLNNLAELLRVTNQLDEAEPLYQRALAISEASYGPDNPMVAIGLNNLAGLLQATNRLGDAEPLYSRALAIDEASYGPKHPSVAKGLNNLAELLRATNRLDEAEPLYRRALAIYEASYGPDHSHVATCLNNLAALLKDTNRLGEAGPLLRRALAIYEASYGPDHPDVATALNNLAELLQATNRFGEAEPLYRRALAIFEASLPEGHPNTETVRANLEVCLWGA